MLFLVTEIWKRHGGVQRYMQMLLRILENSGEPFTAVSLLDPQTSLAADSRAQTVGCSGNKLKFCVRALRCALRFRPDLCIVGHVSLAPVAWALRRLKLIDRYIVVLHGIEAWIKRTPLSRIAARDAFAIVATTGYTAREFCALNGIQRDKCFVIPLAGTFRIPAENRREIGQELRLVTVARLSRTDAYKGIETVLRTIHRGRALGLKFTLDLIGDGDDRPRLQELARSLDIESAVCFRGSVPDNEIEASLQGAQVFVMPSKKEGFGIVYLEAMAAGLPCIGANHGGTPEVIEHGVSGFLIEYDDVDQLAFYCRSLLESPELYAAMSAAARHRASRVLTPATMAEDWSKLLNACSRRQHKPGLGGIEPATEAVAEFSYNVRDSGHNR